MVAVDTNLLVYAHRADSESHAKADRLIARLAEGRASWAIPWPCLYEFHAIVTHPKIYRPPTPPADALIQIGYWLESPSLVLLHEGDGFFDTLRPVLAASNGGCRRWRNRRGTASISLGATPWVAWASPRKMR